MIHKHKDSLVYRRGKKYIRSTFHEFDSYLNTSKMNDVDKFINEYRRMAKIMLNELWCMKYTWSNPKKTINYSMLLKHNKIEQGCPTFLRTTSLNCVKYYKGHLSGRALSSLATQLIGIVNGAVKVANATKTRVIKPNVDNINPELPSRHVNFVYNEDGSLFEMFVGLQAMTNKRGKVIVIPIKIHKLDKYYLDELKGKLLNSISLSKTSIALRYEMNPDIKTSKKSIIGADIGINKVCTFSDGKMTSKKNKQGKTIEDITKSIKNCKFNSKNYKRKLIERDCFINEVLNNISLKDIDVLRLESNKGIKESTKNANKYWKTSQIISKILRMCQISQVDLWSCPSYYKSQRCFRCGFTHKRNRNKEKFECSNCYHTDDADLNASKNNSIELPYQDLWLYHKKNRDCGFFWNLNGVVLNDEIGSVASPSK